MNVEYILYGMFNGKICLLKTDNVNAIISDKNLEFLRKLRVEDSDQHWWLPTEQLVALPHVQAVKDENGRDWVQNHTLLIPLHDYIQITKHIFDRYFLPILDEPPERLEPLHIP